jgi:hypothetical protein
MRTLTTGLILWLLLGLAAACSRPEPLGFAPFDRPTSVIVNNARGAYYPRTIRDSSTLGRLVAIMDRYRDGWAAQPKSAFGTRERPTCAYGIGFYDNGRWVAGVSIETDGTTVARSQFGTAIVYKSDTLMGSEMLAVLGRPQR